MTINSAVVIESNKISFCFQKVVLLDEGNNVTHYPELYDHELGNESKSFQRSLPYMEFDNEKMREQR